MDTIRLTKSFKSRLMDPDFEDMRLAAGLKDSVLDMINMRYEFLFSLDNLIKGSPPNIPNDPPKNLESHLLLYKAGLQSRLARVQDTRYSLDFQALSSKSPTNSNRSGGGILLSELPIARKYGEWARQKAGPDFIPIAIFHVAIPTTIVFEGVYELRDDDEFRRFVWANRRDKQLDKDLRHLNEKPWLKGPIVHNSTGKIKNMDDRSKIELLKVNGKTAFHYYTQHFETYDLLNEHYKGKIWLTLAKPES